MYDGFEVVKGRALGDRKELCDGPAGDRSIPRESPRRAFAVAGYIDESPPATRRGSTWLCGALGVDSCSTQFSNAIVDAAGARNHDRRISASGSRSKPHQIGVVVPKPARGRKDKYAPDKVGGTVHVAAAASAAQVLNLHMWGQPPPAVHRAKLDCFRQPRLVFRPFPAQTLIFPISCQAPKTPQFRLTPSIYSRYISQFFAGSPNSN